MTLQPKEILILGAGLTGLTTAYFLQKAGVSCTILEARPRLGGRIETDYQVGQAPVEKGATWLGLKHQHLVDLLDELGLSTFEQILGEQAIYESISTSPPQLVQLPPNTDPSYRIQGGSFQLIQALADQLAADTVRLGAAVEAIVETENGIEVRVAGQSYLADQVISTLPPRLLMTTVAISPALPQDLVQVAEKTHTWMGESIKVALRATHPFWREPGRSGTVFSNVGPVSELYDHANVEDTHFALKGFLNGAYFAATLVERKAVVLQQMRRYYGQAAVDSLTYEEAVWRNEAFTFAEYDGPVLPHQHNGHPVFRQGFFGGKLWIAGAETAQEFPGYMDGAVQSAHWVSEQVLAIL